MPSMDGRFSSLLYRLRGFILGVIAVALVCVSPSTIPEGFCANRFRVNNCVAGILIAILLYVASALLRVQSRRFIGEHTRGKIHAADALVTCGPYACVRHPLYISNTGFALGMSFFHLGVSYWIVPFMMVVVAFEIALSKIEDRFLERKFGDTWRAWASVTPAFFPRGEASRFYLGHEADTQTSDSLCDVRHVLSQRTFRQAFFADASTWFWLLFCNLLLVLRKVVVFYV